MNTSSSNTPAPAHRNFLSDICERLAKRPDSEHAQAFMRIIIGGAGLIYVIFSKVHGKLTFDQHHMFYVASSFVLAAIGILALIMIRPQTSHIRRLTGMVLDFSATSYFMYVMEERATVFFAVYLWVTVGNGLRYGTRYLYTAMIMSIASFVAVLGNSAYWQEQWSFSAGLLIGMVALPIYFSSLLKQLNRQHAELKKLYEQTARHATHDFLTGLPNRKHFYDQLEKSISSTNGETRSFAVLYLDLDGFKTINDAYGHRVGDQIIESTACRLKQCLRNDDFVARIGGDEFIVLLRNITLFSVSRTAEKIIEVLSEPSAISENSLNVTTSIGIAIYPQHGKDAHELINNADGAMYEAKRSGKNNYKIFHNKLTLFAPIHQSLMDK